MQNIQVGANSRNNELLRRSGKLTEVPFKHDEGSWSEIFHLLLDIAARIEQLEHENPKLRSAQVSS